MAVDGAGNVFVTGSSSNGSNNDYATVKYSQMTLTAHFSASTACLGNATEFTDLSSATTPATQYAWDFDGDGTTDATTVGDVSYTYPGAGTYQATLTLTDGAESEQKEVTVTVHPLPTVNLGEDIILCPGSAATLDAGTGFSYLWSTGETTQQITVNQTGTYSVTITNGNGCQQNDEIQVLFEDTEAPQITAPAPIEVNTDPGQCTASVEFSAQVTDDCDASVTPVFSISSEGGATAISSPYTFPVGETIVDVNATDAAGNAATGQSFTVTVNDAEVPIFATHNINVPLDENGQASLAVADIYNVAGSSDNCGIDAASLALDISSFDCNNVGTPVTVTLSGSDVHGNTASATASVTVVDNLPPVAIAQDITVQLDATGQASITPQAINNGSSDNCAIASLTLDQNLFTCADVGPNTVTLTVTDVNGNQSLANATITIVDDTPPQIMAPADITVGNDPGICGAVVSLGTPVTSDNCGVQNVTNNAPAVFDGGITLVTWTVTDVNGNENTAIQTVEVTNDAPVLGVITAPAGPVQVGTLVNASVPFTDNNLSTAEWDWGDGSFTAGQIGAGTVTGSHTYTVPGVYTLTLMITDACGVQDMATFEFVVIVNPVGESIAITGIGQFNSPPGASTDFPTAEGTATFNCRARFRGGDPIPTGRTTFGFRAAGNLNFRSTSYQWLVISNAKATLKGEGTIRRRSGTFGFLVAAIDGDMPGGGGIDKFRIKIWNQVSGQIVYDNEPGAPEDAAASTAITAGSIVIQKTGGTTARYEDVTTRDMPLEERGWEKPAAFNLNVYPNPLQQALTVELESELEEEVTLSIYDLLGRNVYEHKQTVAIGHNQILLDVDRWNKPTVQMIFRLHTPSQGSHQRLLIRPE